MKKWMKKEKINSGTKDSGSIKLKKKNKSRIPSNSDLSVCIHDFKKNIFCNYLN